MYKRQERNDHLHLPRLLLQQLPEAEIRMFHSVLLHIGDLIGQADFFLLYFPELLSLIHI